MKFPFNKGKIKFPNGKFPIQNCKKIQKDNFSTKFHIEMASLVRF